MADEEQEKEFEEEEKKEMSGETPEEE